jgi:hypothetical protein
VPVGWRLGREARGWCRRLGLGLGLRRAGCWRLERRWAGGWGADGLEAETGGGDLGIDGPEVREGVGARDGLEVGEWRGAAAGGWRWGVNGSEAVG